MHFYLGHGVQGYIFQRFSRAGPRGRGREWATLGVHPLSWLLSNNRLEEVCSTLTKGTFSSRLLLSNQDKGCIRGCIPSVAHSLPLPLGPALLNLSIISTLPGRLVVVSCTFYKKKKTKNKHKQTNKKQQQQQQNKTKNKTKQKTNKQTNKKQHTHT